VTEGAIAVLAAMPEELAALRPRLRGAIAVPAERSLGTVTWSLFAGRATLLAVLGEGAPAAERGVSRLLETFRPAAVLLLGVGGSLGPTLEPTEVAMAGEVRGPGEELPLRPDPRSQAWAAQARLPWARMISVNRLVGCAEQKSLLNRAHGEDLPAMVDLESWTVARACAEAGVPWAIARAVSDSHRESLPRCIVASQRQDGSVWRGAVAARALRNPRELPSVWRLKCQLWQCAAALAKAAEILIRTAPSDEGFGQAP
jgi:nucleoside phosphorylase